MSQEAPAEHTGKEAPHTGKQPPRPKHSQLVPFVKGYDPRRVPHPRGPTPTTTEAIRYLRSQAVKYIGEIEKLTQDAPDAEPCALCGRGLPRGDDLKLRALVALVDRAGLNPTNKITVERTNDDGWVDFTTNEESEAVYEIMERALARMLAAAASPALEGGVIDVKAESTADVGG